MTNPVNATGIPDGCQSVDTDTALGYLDGLLNNSGGVMYVKDAAESRFVLVNRELARLVGLPISQIIGKTSHDIFPAELADSHRVNDLLVLSDGVSRTAREFATRTDGAVREFISHKFALLDPTGRPYAVGGISTDVTDLVSERRATLRAQYESEARFRTVFEHAPIGQIFSEVGGSVTEVNDPLAAMLGYQPQEMLGRQISDFAEPEEMRRIQDSTARLLNGTKPTVSAIRRFRHRDGHSVPVRVTSVLLRDAAGVAQWWASLVLDMTDEEQARKDLERAHRATVRAAERLQVLHAIAGAANEAADIETAAPRVLQAIGRHLGWHAGVLLRWPALAGQPRAVVAGLWSDERNAQPLSAETLRLHAPGCAPQAPDRPSTPARLQPIAAGAPFGRRGAVLVPIQVESGPRYAWLFFTSEDCGAMDGLDADSTELLDLVCLETSRLAGRQAAQNRVLDIEQRFRSIFTGSALPMALSVTAGGEWSEVNPAMCALLGRREAELVGRSTTDFTHPGDVALLEPAGAAAFAAADQRHSIQLRLQHADGRTLITDITLTWMLGQDGAMLLLAQFENITARVAAEETLRRQADEDSLTGLANRAFLNRTLRRHAGGGSEFAALFIDLDGFKVINDSRGHEVGDEVLVVVARRLERAVRPSDVVARFGGDEFVALCKGPIEAAEARLIARRIERSLAAPIPTASGTVRVTASVGISCGLIEADSPTDLLQRADVAMYHAKRLGKDRSELYDERLHERALATQRMESALRTALDENRFILHYQPIVDLASRRIVGVEALVRLLDEAGKLVSPQEFIGVAEDTGLIVPMGTWVLREACATLNRLQRETDLPLTMSVNVAASQAARSDLRDIVAQALADASLDESRLCIELTESALLEADESTLHQLNQLRASGVGIALDDFGTGYSSLTYLRAFPVSTIKIDRSFVAGIGSRQGDLAIVRAVAGLARDLGVGCVAEGIETQAQLTAVASLGVPLGQGYLFSKPCPATELIELLRTEALSVRVLGA